MKSNVAAGEVLTSPALFVSSRALGGADPVPTAFPDDAEDQDTGDVSGGVDEDALNQDDLDTDQITDPE